MRLHITNLYGISGSSATSVAMHSVAKIASEFAQDAGLEVSIYKYPSRVDNDVELVKRLDGIMSPVSIGDIVILQLPTWNDMRYEERLIDKLKNYQVKLIMFIHDVVPLQFDSGEENLRAVINLYNKADVLILPSKKMYECLKEHGLKVEKVCFQTIFDYPLDVGMERHTFQRKMIFTGSPDRFGFVNHYQGKTPIVLYGKKAADPDSNTKCMGERIGVSLLSEMSEGGFGLVWAGDDQYAYYRLNLPFKATTFLAAGNPLIVQKGIHVADFVKEQEIGWEAESIEEADQLVQSLTEQQYRQTLDNVKRIQFLITHGYYTRKVLTDAVILALEK